MNSKMNKTSRRKEMKALAVLLVLLLCVGTVTGCGASANEITVVSREEGSGTRGAFTELFGIEQKDENGNKIDKTIATADQTNSTGVMLQSVSQNESAIGYVSLGSLKDTVKAVKIDGVQASVENIKNGSYTVSRPFTIATKETVSAAAKDFIMYILSAEGQKIIEEKGYIAVAGSESYQGSAYIEKIVVAGSSSVAPVMEKLIEGYKEFHPDAEIELQTSDSTTGVNSVAEGICEIGMASRELKDSETAKGINATVIAMDGIAVIVNLNNTIDNLTKDDVLGIYTGTIVNWSEIQQ